MVVGHFSLLLLAITARAQQAFPTSLSLAVSSAVPANASGTFVDLSFTGFAFEQASFSNFSTDNSGNPNTFSQNLISSVLNRTGGTPILRVGGTSGDLGHYNYSQTQQVVPTASQGPPLTTYPFLSVGASYFTSFQNFPGVSYIFMIPLAHNNRQMSLTWARQGIAEIGADNIQALELGNEPDLYPQFNSTNSTRYVQNFLALQAGILKALAFELPKTTRLFQALDISSGRQNFLTIQGALNLGINDNGNIKTFSYHLYQGFDAADGIAGLQTRIANHTAIVNAMYGFVPSINYLNFADPDTPFILGEVGNTLGSGNSQQRNNMATVLWNVDMQLYAMSIGVARVNMQNMINEGFSMWLPVDIDGLDATVLPNFYSQPFVADFIGPSGVTQVANYELDSDYISAYAAYDNSTLARIAIVNFELWSSGVSLGDRPSTSVTITGLPKSVKSVSIALLSSASGTYATNDVTWQGYSWNVDSTGFPQQTLETTVKMTVVDGQVTVNVLAASAVIIFVTDQETSGLSKSSSSTTTTTTTQSTKSTRISTTSSILKRGTTSTSKSMTAKAITAKTTAKATKKTAKKTTKTTKKAIKTTKRTTTKKVIKKPTKKVTKKVVKTTRKTNISTKKTSTKAVKAVRGKREVRHNNL